MFDVICQYSVSLCRCLCCTIQCRCVAACAVQYSVSLCRCLCCAVQCRCVAACAVQYSVSLCRCLCCTVQCVAVSLPVLYSTSVSLCRCLCSTVQCVAVSLPVLYSTLCPATIYLRPLLSLFLTSDTRELTQRPPVLRFSNFEICVMYSIFSETVVWRS